MSASATPDPVIRQIVEAMRTLAGPHPGFRPVHAKGLVCSGTFRASADAPRVTRAPHFAGQPVPTVVRFANSSGNPEVHDGVPNVRSMAVKFQLGDDKSADILANSVEGFVARTPEELLEFLRAQLPVPATGRPDPDALPRFLAGHPAGRGFVERLMKRPVPASYGQVTYLPSTRSASPPWMARADSAAIASCRRPARPSSPLTIPARRARAS
jgi:catalase